MSGTSDTASLLTQAVAAQRSGDAAQAARLYEAVLAQDARNADALHLLGIVMAERGDAGRAGALMQAALESNPKAAPIHFNFANLLQSTGALREALAHYDMALGLDPTAAQAWYNRGNCLERMGLTEDSLASFDAAVRVRPAYAAAALNRGVALQKLGRFEAAVAAFQSALDLRPGYVQALCNLSNVLRMMGRWDEARAVAEAAVASHPGHADCHAHLGNVLQMTGDATGALHSYGQALALAPELASAHWNRALTLLRSGDYGEGWREFEWRKRLSTPVAARSFTQPEWTGIEDIAGKTVFLHWEQGLGDTLQFCRYVPLVRARGARVVLAVQDPLVRLARTLDPDIIVISSHAVPSRFDLHCPLMSLPGAFGTSVPSIPAHVPYLHADVLQTEGWRKRLMAEPGLKVGLVWSGAPRPEDPDANAIDRRRSMSLAQFHTLAEVAGVRFVSLQKGPAAREAMSSAEKLNLRDWTSELTDFHDTAALVASLDLVISVDTSVAHLAGALGVPVWVLNRFDHCWRWLSGSGTSPWYPSARLFRQPLPGDWQTVMREVADALSHWAAGRT